MARQAAIRLAPHEKFGLDRREAAAFVGVKVADFDKMVGNGSMPPARRFGDELRWLRPELELYSNDMPAEGPAPVRGSPYATPGLRRQ